MLVPISVRNDPWKELNNVANCIGDKQRLAMGDYNTMLSIDEKRAGASHTKV